MIFKILAILVVLIVIVAYALFCPRPSQLWPYWVYPLKRCKICRRPLESKNKINFFCPRCGIEKSI